MSGLFPIYTKMSHSNGELFLKANNKRYRVATCRNRKYQQFTHLQLYRSAIKVRRSKEKF